jgi:hypothetical protein
MQLKKKTIPISALAASKTRYIPERRKKEANLQRNTERAAFPPATSQRPRWDVALPPVGRCTTRRGTKKQKREHTEFQKHRDFIKSLHTTRQARDSGREKSRPHRTDPPPQRKDKRNSQLFESERGVFQLFESERGVSRAARVRKGGCVDMLAYT